MVIDEMAFMDDDTLPHIDMPTRSHILSETPLTNAFDKYSCGPAIYNPDRDFFLCSTGGLLSEADNLLWNDFPYKALHKEGDTIVRKALGKIIRFIGQGMLPYCEIVPVKVWVKEWVDNSVYYYEADFLEAYNLQQYILDQS